MKTLLIILTIVFCCHASVLHANVGSPDKHDTTEMLLITANSAVSFVNFAGMISGNPLDWAIGFGAVAGLTTIVYTLTAENLEHETGMPLTRQRSVPAF